MKRSSRIALILCMALLSACANPHNEAADWYQQTMIAKWGPMNKWTPEQQQAYIAGLQRLFDVQQQQLSTQRVASQQPTPYQPVLSNSTPQSAQPSGLGFRSWHNSDGSSGQYVPYPGGNGGTIFNSDGTTSQLVPYPGGKGGAIYNSDGTVTNIDPAIGH